MTEHNAPAVISALRSELKAFVDQWAAVARPYDPSECEIPAHVWQPGQATLKEAGYSFLTASEEQLATAHAPALRQWAKREWPPLLSKAAEQMDDLRLWRRANSLPSSWFRQQENEAREVIAGIAAGLFLNVFAPLASKIVKAIGRQNWPDEPPDPPEIPGEIRPDDLAAELFGIASNNTLEAGKTCLLWGAMAHEPKSFRRPKGWPSKIFTWAQYLIVPIEGGNGYRAMVQPIEWALESLESLTSTSVKAEGTGRAVAAETMEKRQKRKVQRPGDEAAADIALIAALTKHHQYAKGGCLNLEAIGSNALARQAKVSTGSASGFFQRHFKGHRKYKLVFCRDAVLLVNALKMLNGDFSPWILSDPKEEDPPDERKDQDDG